MHPFPIKSTETVNAVLCGSVLLETMRSRFNSSQRSCVRATQISPLPNFVMKLITSGVTISAGAIKSPSFSRFSSSTTITTLPILKSAMASSILFNFTSTVDIVTFFRAFQFPARSWFSSPLHPLVWLVLNEKLLTRYLVREELHIADKSY